jgi:hypothetical protein
MGVYIIQWKNGLTFLKEAVAEHKNCTPTKRRYDTMEIIK